MSTGSQLYGLLIYMTYLTNLEMPSKMGFVIVT